MSAQIHSDIAVLRSEAVPLIASALVLLGLYALSISVEPGWGTFLISVPAFVVAMVTALERANVICPRCVGLRWHFRRVAFVLLGLAAVWLVSMPLGDTPKFPEWHEVFFYWGTAGAFLTTPKAGRK